MTLHERRRFSVSVATMGTTHEQMVARCGHQGHTEPDGRGRCYRCGAKVPENSRPHLVQPLADAQEPHAG